MNTNKIIIAGVAVGILLGAILLLSLVLILKKRAKSNKSKDTLPINEHFSNTINPEANLPIPQSSDINPEDQKRGQQPCSQKPKTVSQLHLYQTIETSAQDIALLESILRISTISNQMLEYFKKKYGDPEVTDADHDPNKVVLEEIEDGEDPEVLISKKPSPLLLFATLSLITIPKVEPKRSLIILPQAQVSIICKIMQL